MNKTLLLGWHVALSVPLRITQIANAIKSEGFKPCMQFFASSPSRYQILTSESIMRFQEGLNVMLANEKILPFIHSSYLINFCRPDYAGISLLSQDLNIMSAILDNSVRGYKPGVVLHTGKNTLSLSLDDCIENFIQNLIETCRKTIQDSLIILETSVCSKKDTDLFCRLENLSLLYARIPSEIKTRIRFCIDTCHIFASGYDISSTKGFNDYIMAFDRGIGISQIALFHLNDSKMPLNSRRDLHADIGSGYIYSQDLGGLSELLSVAQKHEIPIIMETPGNVDYLIELSLIKKAYLSFMIV